MNTDYAKLKSHAISANELLKEYERFIESTHENDRLREIPTEILAQVIKIRRVRSLLGAFGAHA